MYAIEEGISISSLLQNPPNPFYILIVVLQRVSEASVSINNTIESKIDMGLLILIGITHEDNEEDIKWLTKKIIGLRIFKDINNKMNLSLLEVKGEILLISQFTLFASTKKGNRPSFLDSAPPEKAIPLYHNFIDQLSKDADQNIKTGEFGADMKVSLVNDGPVTIILDSKNKK